LQGLAIAGLDTEEKIDEPLHHLRVKLCILVIALGLDPLEILTPTLDVLLLLSLLVLLLQPRQQCAQEVASEDGAFCIVGDNGPSLSR
jgi:hypothetical protein